MLFLNGGRRARHRVLDVQCAEGVRQRGLAGGVALTALRKRLPGHLRGEAAALVREHAGRRARLRLSGMPAVWVPRGRGVWQGQISPPLLFGTLLEDAVEYFLQAAEEYDWGFQVGADALGWTLRGTIPRR